MEHTYSLLYILPVDIVSTIIITICNNKSRLSAGPNFYL